MKKNIFWLMLFCLCGSGFLYASPPDSLRIEVIDGERFVVHQVDPGEYLSLLANRYRVDPLDIRVTNKLEDGVLTPGQMLYIPLKGQRPSSAFAKPIPKIQVISASEAEKELKKTNEAPVKKEEIANEVKKEATSRGTGVVDQSPPSSAKELIVTSKSTTTPKEKRPPASVTTSAISGLNGGGVSKDKLQKKYHVVRSGQTLFSIASSHNLTVNQLKEMNSLENNTIAIGQKLIVGSVAGAAGLDENEEEPKTELVIPAGKIPGKHRVLSGETLYSISKKHDIPIEIIKRLNSMESNQLKSGQVLTVWKNVEKKEAEKPVAESPQVEKKPEIAPKIEERSVSKPSNINVPPFPATKDKLAVNQGNENTAPPTKDQETLDTPAPPKRKFDPSRAKQIHVVKEGETLFGLAKSYGMDVWEVKALNRMNSDVVSPGRELVVFNPNEPEPMAPKKPVAVPESTPQPVVKQSKEKVKVDTQPGNIATVKPVSSPVATKIVIPEEANAQLSSYTVRGKKYWKVYEIGAVGVMKDSEEWNDKFFAIHKTLPIGTILMIEDARNDFQVTVEIVDKLAQNDTAKIRISKRAAEYIMLGEGLKDLLIRYTLPSDKD